METVLIGRFENDTMKAAKQSRIIGERCRNGIKEIKVKRPQMESPFLYYNRPNLIRISDKPTLMDALDRRNIFIKSGPFGEGVFAKRNFVSGDIVAYYSGLLWPPTDLFPINQTLHERSVGFVITTSFELFHVMTIYKRDI